MMKEFNKLLETGKTVRRVADIQALLGITDADYARLLLHRAKKEGVLLSPYRGIFVLPHFDLLELASKIRPGSYISFETVLQKHGILFQHYEHTITLASDNTLTKTVGAYTMVFHKLADRILYNPLGIITITNKYQIASPERAVADMVYLTGNIYFDNTRSLNMQKLAEIASLYPTSTSSLILDLIAHAQQKHT